MSEPPRAGGQPGHPLDDPLAEALRLVDLATQRGIPARLLGGMGVRARLPTWVEPPEAASSPRRDVDLATRAPDAARLAALLGEAGYRPDAHHNALYGHKHLYFLDPAHDRPVDVLVDALDMCHRIEFGDRLTVDEVTLPLAELLLSKLQVVRLTRKDAVHALALLGHFPLGDADGDTINLGVIVALTSHDWGWWRTVVTNLDALAALARDETARSDGTAIRASGEGATPLDPEEQIRHLRRALDEAPKSRRWRLRARIGERLRWYEEPEEIAH